MVVVFVDGVDVRMFFIDLWKQVIDVVNQIQLMDEFLVIGEVFEFVCVFMVLVDFEIVGSEEFFEQFVVFEIFFDGFIFDVDDQLFRVGEFVSYIVIGLSDMWNIGLMQIVVECLWDCFFQIQVFVVVVNNVMEFVKVDVELWVGGRVCVVILELFDIFVVRIDEDLGWWIFGCEWVVFVFFE